MDSSKIFLDISKTLAFIISEIQSQNRGGCRRDDRPHKTYESNFIHHDSVEFGKQHSRYKAILSSTDLSQQCCKVYFISVTVVNP